MKRPAVAIRRLFKTDSEINRFSKDGKRTNYTGGKMSGEVTYQLLTTLNLIK